MPFLICLVTASLVLLGAFCRAATVDEGWDALLKNDVTTAESVFQTCVQKSPKDLDALDGLALALWTRGDMPQAAGVWMRLARRGGSRPWWAGYLAALAIAELQGIPPKQRAKFLKDLTANPELSSSQDQEAIWREILEWEEKWGDPKKARRAAERAGVIFNWWFVLGPFGKFGTMDLWEPFPPEKDLAAPSYPGWISTVSRRDVPEDEPTGKVDLESLIYPSQGTAYAFTAIESEGDARARLTIESPGNYVVWWDGHPVLTRSNERRDFFTESTVEIRLRKGVIPLLVKSCRRGPDWWIRVSIHPAPGENLPKWHVAEKDETLLDRVVTYPLSDFMNRKVELGWKVSDENPRHKILAALYGSLVHFRKAEFTEARECLAPALEANITQAYALLGDLCMREAARRPHSRSRLQREAETAYRQATKRYPAALDAHTGLISYFLERDNVDQALEYLEGVQKQLKREKIRYWANIDYAFGLLYYRKNWMDESLAALQRSVRTLAPSPAAFRWIAHIQANWGDRVGALETLKRGLAVFPDHEGMADEVVARLEGGTLDPDLRSKFAQRIAVHPYRIQDLLRMIGVYRHSGQIKQAEDLGNKLVALYPNRPEPLRELARIRATADTDRLSDSAVDLYRRVLKIAPGDREARKALRQAGQSEDTLIERYDIHLDDLDLSQADRWKKSRAPDIYLIDVMVLILDRQGTYRQYIHQAVKVLNSEGRQRWAETVIPKGDNVEIRLARSILPDGTEWPVQHVADLRDQQALSMYGVENGTIIEYAYLKTVSDNLYPGANYFTGGYFFGAIDEPMLVSKLSVILPEKMEYLVDVKPKEFGAREKLDDGRVTLTWENRLQDGIRKESFMPPLSEVVPSLRLSTWTDWRIGLERWRQRLLGRFEDGPALDEIVRRFEQNGSAGASPSQDKSPSGDAKDRTSLVRKVYDWIQKEIESGGGSYTTLDTAVLRTGSGREKTLLAQDILRRLGIPSALGVVVKNRPDDGFAPQPIAGFSGSLFLRVDAGRETPTWLDFSSRHIAAGEVDGQNRAGVALVLAKEGERFEPVDPKVWPQGWIQRRLQLHPNADRSATIEGSYTYRGTHRRSLLSLIVDKDAKRKFKDSQVSGDLRGIVIDRSELLDVNSPYGTPQLKFSGRIPNFIQPGEKGALRLPGVPCRVKASGLVGEVTRETPLKFKRARVTEPLEARVDLGPLREAGYDLVYLPEDTIRLAPYGYYALTYRREGDQIIIRRSVLVPPQTIETKEYGRFAAFCREIDEAERRDIVFAKANRE